MDGYYVYVLASQRNGTLYIGVTNDVARRVAEHKAGIVEGFTRKYGVAKLVHVERFIDINEAIAREKAMKKWRRAWKLELIEQSNPTWTDLYETINA
jgi:putative endonuclease